MMGTFDVGRIQMGGKTIIEDSKFGFLEPCEWPGKILVQATWVVMFSCFFECWRQPLLYKLCLYPFVGG